LFARHLSEQNLTSSQFFSHFFRQEKGRPQVTQILVGRWELFFWGIAYFFVSRFEKFLIDPEVFFGKTAEKDLRNRGSVKFVHGCNRDFGSISQWIVKYPGADARKSDGVNLPLDRKVKRISVATCQQLPFLKRAPAPNWADRMDDEVCWEIVPPSDLRLTRFASAELDTFLKKPRSSGSMNRSVNSRSSQ
jgi:hypothetical protein